MDLSATIHLLGEALGEVLRDAGVRRALRDRGAHPRARQGAARRRGGRRRRGWPRRWPPCPARRRAGHGVGLRRLLRPGQPGRGGAPHPAPCASASASSTRSRSRESVGEAVAALQARGVAAERMAALLRRAAASSWCSTAHPTEAKRRTVLSQAPADRARRCARCSDPDLLPRERDAAVPALRAEITALWLTDRARTARPAVTDEVRTASTSWTRCSGTRCPGSSASSTRRCGAHYPGLRAPAGWLTLASWIGGDRDGNPSVVTAGHRGDPAAAPRAWPWSGTGARSRTWRGG